LKNYFISLLSEICKCKLCIPSPLIKTSHSFLIPRQRPHDKNETHRHHPDVRQRDPTLLCGWQTGDQQIVQHRQPDAKQDDRVGKGTVAHERIVVVVVLLVVLFRQQQFQFSDLDVLPGRAPTTYLVPFCVHHHHTTHDNKPTTTTNRKQKHTKE
jgi:hypothetical protein